MDPEFICVIPFFKLKCYTEWSLKGSKKDIYSLRKSILCMYYISNN